MKGYILNPEQFDPIVYGGQTMFIKTFPSSLGRIILQTEQGHPLPYTVSSSGEPLRPVLPHYKQDGQLFIKEDWRVISILHHSGAPQFDGSNAILYVDDLFPVLSPGEQQRGINSFLFNHPLSPHSLPGIQMKASQPMTASSMPFWAARYGLLITSVSFKYLHQLHLHEAIDATGNPQMTIDTFQDIWDSKAKRSHAWQMNPPIGLYRFRIVRLNGYSAG